MSSYYFFDLSRKFLAFLFSVKIDSGLGLKGSAHRLFDPSGCPVNWVHLRFPDACGGVVHYAFAPHSVLLIVVETPIGN